MTPQYQKLLEKEFGIEIFGFRHKEGLKAKFSFLRSKNERIHQGYKIKLLPGQTYRYAIQRALHTQ